MRVSKKLGLAIIGGLLVTTAIGFQAASYEHHEGQETETLNAEFPAGIKGDRMRTYFDAYNARDPEAFRKWFFEHRSEMALSVESLDDLLKEFQRDLDMFGVWTISEVNEVQPNIFEVLAQEDGRGEWRKVIFVFEDTSPNKIGPMGIEHPPNRSPEMSFVSQEGDGPMELNPDLPPGIQGERMRGYFDAFDNKSQDEYRAWLLENRTEEALAVIPLDDRLEQFQMDLDNFGAWTNVHIEEVKPNVFEVLQQEADHGEWRKVLFVFEDNAPYKIGPMALMPAVAPGQVVNFDFPWNNLEEFIDQYRAQTSIPAVALGVMKDGWVVDIAAKGQRLVDGPEDIEPDDKFHWGSITKSVTGTMIGKLIEDGVLDWDTTVGEVLGDLEMRDEYRNAKLWQVMGHQARIPGYGNIDGDMVARFQAYSGSETERRAQFLADVLLEDPVRVGVYSNAGLTLAGYMAEVATGRTWQDLVQEHVFDAIGMATAGFGWPVTRDDPNQRHFGDPGNYEPQPDGAMEEIIKIMSPAGDVHSSIGDMLKYGQFHLDGMAGKDGYLKAETVQGLHTPRPGQEPVFGGHYTFGWGHFCMGLEDAGACQGHNGSAGTYFAEIQIYQEHNMVSAYFSNVQNPAEFYSMQVFRALYDRYSR